MGQAVDLLFRSLLYRLRSFQAPVNEGSSSLVNGHVFWLNAFVSRSWDAPEIVA